MRMRDLPAEKEKCEREGEKETGLVENPPPLHSYLILIKNFLSTTKANAALGESPGDIIQCHLTREKKLVMIL